MPMHVILPYNVISGLCNGAAFAMREKDETPFVYAQMKTRNYSPQVEWANWPQPIGRTQLDTADWLVKLRLVGCGQLYLSESVYNSNYSGHAISNELGKARRW